VLHSQRAVRWLPATQIADRGEAIIEHLDNGDGVARFALYYVLWNPVRYNGRLGNVQIKGKS
jgi:hypothetical protein